jgi:hypothetical protein
VSRSLHHGTASLPNESQERKREGHCRRSEQLRRNRQIPLHHTPGGMAVGGRQGGDVPQCESDVPT